ncbi:general stress protein [Brooklawnia cerclae]|uniref:General stress protein 17M-like domain-containing protein n=2 Tax=Brooklawnia cerclae TaxID=349934 RepID=A0ABX0SLM7_9ACTN|nr:general stress protein [Brooklawnia cerclae]NIH57641.1 hypothetical protein [Brooklawnia cerclae]
MSMNQASSLPSASDVLKLRRPMSVAIYDEYADAQRAVDYLADRQFPVANLAIVGTDLKSFEKVTGRMTWGRILLAGFLNGIMWAGMFAIIMWMLNPSMSLVNALIIALVGFGLVGMGMSAIQYRMRGGARDYTSMTGIIATHYEVLAESDFADRARHLLSGGQARRTREVSSSPQAQPAPQPTAQTAQAAPVDLGTLPPPFGQRPSDPASGVGAWGTAPQQPVVGAQTGSVSGWGQWGAPAQSAPVPGAQTAAPQPAGAQPAPPEPSAPATGQDSARPNAAELPYGQYWNAQGSQGIGDLPESLRGHDETPDEEDDTPASSGEDRPRDESAGQQGTGQA